jgi:hypothetical protein
MFLGALKARGLDTGFADVEPAAKEPPKAAAAGGGRR